MQDDSRSASVSRVPEVRSLDPEISALVDGIINLRKEPTPKNAIAARAPGYDQIRPSQEERKQAMSQHIQRIRDKNKQHEFVGEKLKQDDAPKNLRQ